MAQEQQHNGHIQQCSRPRHLIRTNALIFSGLALLLNVYVIVTLGLSGPRDYANLLDIPRSMIGNFNTYTETNADSSLAIVSACIPGERFPPEYISASHVNKRHYCHRYNAECILPTERVEPKSDLHPKWDKLYHINHTLYTKQIDWVLWMDCDAAFTNFEINWQQHLKPHLNSYQLMIVSADDEGGINLGVFLVPNTRLSRKFIENMYKMRWSLDKRFFHKDQTALKAMMEKYPQVQNRLEIVPQKLINTYLDNDAGEKWVSYDWIVHQVFCNDVIECGKNFTRIMKMVTPQYYSG
jgi:hypothetical protein